jgi:dTDP-glucose 4,6-dehydratase
VSSGERRVAVLGSNSFSGSDLIDLLLEDPATSVLGVSRSAEKRPLFLPYRLRKDPAFRFLRADLNTDVDSLMRELESFQPQYIVNFAAQSEVAPSWVHPEHWYQTNVVSLARLTSALQGLPSMTRYLHISSPEVYGSCDHPVTEADPLNPSTPYAASKAAADLHLATLVRQHGFPCVTVRSTNVYGPRQQLWKIIPRAAIQLRRGGRIALHGGGAAVKSYIHVRDVSRAEAAVMERGDPGHIYNVSPDHGWSVREVVEKLCALTGTAFGDAVDAVEERPGQDAAYLVDSTRIRRQLGWAPSIHLDDGLREVVQWVDENLDGFKSEDLEYQHRP